jgi:uncharacterized protein YndB with AHSA1/START domain
LSLVAGQQYVTAEGIEGEIRVVKPQERLRMTWRKPGLKRAATLQITLAATSAGKTAVRVHLERLPSQKYRQQMKSYWQEVLNGLADLASSGKRK